MNERRGGQRQRLDLLLVERQLVPTRTKAQALILAGRVFSGPERLDKPGTRLDRQAPLEVREGKRFVSRGGLKLDDAVEAMGVAVTGVDALDVGASTGGFTDVLLRRGASRVIALDVGRGQLDWTLRNDSRVHVVEGLNARHLEPTLLPFLPAIAVVDVSFITLKLVLPAVAKCLAADGEIIALLKPQFEVGREKVGRGGIVRDPELHRQVLAEISGFSAARGWGVAAVRASAIRGAEGNREFFLHLRPGCSGLDEESRAAAIRAATDEPETDR